MKKFVLDIFVLMTLYLAFHMVLSAEQQWMMHSETTWDKEWRSGAWDYLETSTIERSRSAVLGGVFVNMYAPSNASVLEIGCGEGAITDFFKGTQSYVGVDISKEAIHFAKKKRGPPLKFVHAAAHQFEPANKFDVVVFSEVLYYVEYQKILAQYKTYLNPNGLVIISIFHQTEKLLYEEIFKFARNMFAQIDEVDIAGYMKKSRTSNREKTAFRIEVYRLKNAL
jgi:2-polyprenyl-3-methyl-5-hydroxy-6-metoxy-1,4-benzoquinol methylase